MTETQLSAALMAGISSCFVGAVHEVSANHSSAQFFSFVGGCQVFYRVITRCDGGGTHESDRSS
jgi:hypothetical protein